MDSVIPVIAMRNYVELQDSYPLLNALEFRSRHPLAAFVHPHVAIMFVHLAASGRDVLPYISHIAWVVLSCMDPSSAAAALCSAAMCQPFDAPFDPTKFSHDLGTSLNWAATHALVVDVSHAEALMTPPVDLSTTPLKPIPRATRAPGAPRKPSRLDHLNDIRMTLNFAKAV